MLIFPGQTVIYPQVLIYKNPGSDTTGSSTNQKSVLQIVLGFPGDLAVTAMAAGPVTQH